MAVKITVLARTGKGVHWFDTMVDARRFLARADIPGVKIEEGLEREEDQVDA